MNCTININKSVTINIEGLEDEDINFLQRFCNLLVGYRNEKNMKISNNEDSVINSNIKPDIEESESIEEKNNELAEFEDISHTEEIESTDSSDDTESNNPSPTSEIQIDRSSIIKCKNGRRYVLNLIELKTLISEGISVAKIAKDTGLAYNTVKSSVDLIGDKTDNELIDIMTTQMNTKETRNRHISVPKHVTTKRSIINPSDDKMRHLKGTTYMTETPVLRDSEKRALSSLVRDSRNCPICGKLFTPAPKHIYKDKSNQFVCSYSCARKAGTM